jgi:molybdenum cofactor synthesis domain-containing protein
MNDKNNTNTRVAILSTGSEIISGDIQNTNSTYISQKLFQSEIICGEHLTTDDQENNLKNGLNFLLKHNQAVIITGGLGPTEDDRTRFIVSDIINSDLIFDNNSLINIKKRLDLKNILVKENNKKQCLFPKGAVIIENLNGTASGFIINFKINNQNKIIIALPGPPSENKPMLDEIVIPYLLKSNFAYPQYHLRWCVKNIPESDLAEILKPITKKYNIEIAYRIHKPYCDVKIDLPKSKYTDPKIIKNIKNSIENIIKNYL